MNSVQFGFSHEYELIPFSSVIDSNTKLMGGCIIQHNSRFFNPVSIDLLCIKSQNKHLLFLVLKVGINDQDRPEKIVFLMAT